ncbi:MAG: DUF1735 and LamG domain-containing protein [Rikenellaceae bacterium]|nr:DUF1735 and LamG domain-containing protein [Rikenellaceae bacterium]
MKTKINSALAIILAAVFSMTFTACNDEYDYGYDVLLMTGTESDPLISVAIDDVIDSGYYITVSATSKTSEEVRIKLAIDNSKVDEYNEEYETNFYPYPQGDIELLNSEVVIEPGKALSSAAELNIISDAQLIEGPTYVVPITITSATGGGYSVLESSRTVFIRLTKTIEFNSLNMNNTSQSNSMYAMYFFDDSKMVNLSNFTFEIKVLVESFSDQRIRRIANFSSKDEDVNMIRLGESGQENNQLQWVSPGGSISSNKLLEENTWHLISLTYDGSFYRMYLDGEIQNSTDGDLGIAFQMIELGMSYYGYRYTQRVNGRICEIRAWDRALGAREIGFGNCAVDPESRGLFAYWRLNEGSGYIFHDETGNGYDMDWSDVWYDPDGDGSRSIENFDLSGNVRWTVMDALNTCN